MLGLDPAIALAARAYPKDDRERRWLAHQVRQFPAHFGEPLVERFVQRTNAQGKYAAEQFLWDLRGTWTPKNLSLAASDDELCAFADGLAERFRMAISPSPLWNLVYKELSSHARAAGIAPPAVRGSVSYRGAVARLRDPGWLRRALRRSVCRAVENAARALGFVGARRSRFVSQESLDRRRGQLNRLAKFRRDWEAVSEAGDILGLDALAARSLANPSVRRAEFLARVFGFEKLARDLDHVAMFYTITCPGRVHAVLSGSGELNPQFDGTSPAAAQDYLCRLWGRARAKLQRFDVRPYGFRIAEPHHDGTPHWHVLLFVPRSQEAMLTATLRSYALAEDGHEPGALEHRFKAQAIDYAKGTAVAYLAKYISKNLDAYGVGELDGMSGREIAMRASAWASTWGIRQFQQIGGPPVTIWRELRRVGGAPAGLLAEAFAAADKGNWCEFVRITTQSLTHRRRQEPIKTLRVVPLGLNAYTEPALPRVVGVQADGQIVVTRQKEWTLRRRAESSATLEASRWGKSAARVPPSSSPLEFCQ